MKRNRKLKTGFTLVEMVLVVAIVSTIGAAIYQAIFNGLRVWEHSRHFSKEQDIALFLEKLEQDLSNAFNFSSASFVGRQARLKFPTMVHTAADKNSSMYQQVFVKQIGTVEYEFDKLKSQIIRRQADYSRTLNGRFSQERLLVDNVQSVKFAYYYINNAKSQVQGLADGPLPAAVRVDVDFQENTGHLRSMSKMINIPMGL